MKPLLLFSVTLSSNFLIAGVFLLILFFAFIPLLANAMRPRMVVVDFSKLVDGCVSIVVLLIITAIAINWLLFADHGSQNSKRLYPSPHQEQFKQNYRGYRIRSKPYNFRKARHLQRKARAAFPDKKVELREAPRKDREGRAQFYIYVEPFSTEKQADMASKEISRLAREI